ncbi:hypothetical protein BO94DRAFT_602288 [Aspergillus sclerotioniger CBS 115572]|uniref:Rhodopsin domain-containing protein n=1 Tax=Aspergillus sclerotioniger CBS 115572 TaxID=1450535 RepID=A0A317W5I4_9EURO|nr:hypothetical protein BO94DRAFT_602288 [Aspergillus sclerotioniger CBS 115572]PWY80871.1 hypothetical protein BO94DRAFT_602288 [Aspergillus sclerotioniger CBS 115572]
MALQVPDNTPDRGQGVVPLSITLIVLTTFFTFFRVLSKFLAHQAWWWDDLFALIALPLQLVTLSLSFVWRNIGLGYHEDAVATLNPEYITAGVRYLYISTFLFGGSICAPKISAVFFYARVFRSTNRSFRIHLWIVGGLTSGWLLAGWIAAILECRPVAKVWNPTLPGTCIALYPWYLSTAILSSMIDLYILFLPIPMIWGLQASVRRRIYLLAAFMLAYSVIVVSLGRLAAVVHVLPSMSKDITWKFMGYFYWTTLEGSISIISINVPSCIALVQALRQRRRTSVGTKPTSLPTPSSGVRKAASFRVMSWQREPTTRGSVDGLVSDTQACETEYEFRQDMDISLGEILIQTDIRVSSNM